MSVHEYDARPFLKPDAGPCMTHADQLDGCRTDFCDPAGGPYPRKEILDFRGRLEELDRNLAGDDRRKIEAAVDSVFEVFR